MFVLGQEIRRVVDFEDNFTRQRSFVLGRECGRISLVSSAVCDCCGVCRQGLPG